jgi:hypothetical protein
LVPLEEVLPGLLGHQQVRTPVVVLALHVGLLLHSVEIFMESVEEVANELAGVVLVVA